MARSCRALIQSEDCLQFLALLAKLGAQAAGAFERFAGLPRGISVRCNEAAAKRELNLQLARAPLCCLGERAQELQCILILRRRLQVGRPDTGAMATA